MRPYHGNGDIIRVAAFLEPAEGADVVPACGLREEHPPDEGSPGVRCPVHAVVVEVDVPALQRLAERVLK